MVAHALSRIHHPHLGARTVRSGKVPAALVLTATGLAAASLIVVAPAGVSFAGAVVAAGLWCRWLERHDITGERDPQDFLRHSLSPFQGQFPTVVDEDTVR